MLTGYLVARRCTYLGWIHLRATVAKEGRVSWAPTEIHLGRIHLLPTAGNGSRPLST